MGGSRTVPLTLEGVQSYPFPAVRSHYRARVLASPRDAPAQRRLAAEREALLAGLAELGSLAHQVRAKLGTARVAVLDP